MNNQQIETQKVNQEIELKDKDINKEMFQKNKLSNQNYIPQIDSIDIETDIDSQQQQVVNLQQVETFQGTSKIQTFVSLVKAGIGSGLLFTPYIIKECGLVMGCIMFIIIPIGIYYGYMLLVYAMDGLYFKKQTLQEAFQSIFYDQTIKSNKILCYLVKICLFIFNVGGNIAFFILILNSVGLYLKEDEKTDENSQKKVIDFNWLPSIEQKIFISVVLIFPIYFPFSLVSKLQSLHKFNVLGLLINIITFVVIFINSFYMIFNDNNPYKEKQSSEELQNQTPLYMSVPLNFGIIMYLFDINGVITNVRGQMKKPEEFSKVLRNYMVFMSILSFLVGILGYIGYNQNVQANLFINLHEQGIIQGYGDLLAAFYSTSLIFSAVLYAYPVVNFLDKYFEKKQQISLQLEENRTQENLQQQQNKNYKFYLIRILFFLLQIFFSIIFPRIEIVISLLGSIFSVCLGFIFPFILYQITLQKLKLPISNIFSKCILLFGLIGGFLGFLATIYSS